MAFPQRDAFYLSPNRMMGHMDGPFGPFSGDLHTVLALAAK